MTYVRGLFNIDTIRSPLFYVGDKYKLISQLKQYFPKNIDAYIEPFCGGGSSFLNIEAKKYLLNDLDTNLINLHKFLNLQSKDIKAFFTTLFEVIETYNLSCSFLQKIPPKELRETYKKTYFAKFNKENYYKLRDDFNSNKDNMIKLYVLLIYGFNRTLRFNSKGEFNLPVGNVDFNSNVFNALNNYFYFMQENTNIGFYNYDFAMFLDALEIGEKDFIYLDPPYLISGSEYNKLWSEREERKLYEILKELDASGVKWGLSNLLTHKGMENVMLSSFMRNYEIYEIKSNYISFNDNSIKKDSKEVYVTNVKN